MTKLNKTDMVIRLSTGTKTALKKLAAYPWAGEAAIATDTSNLYICTTTEGPFLPVQSLDMALVYENDVLCHENEIVYWD